MATKTAVPFVVLVIQKIHIIKPLYAQREYKNGRRRHHTDQECAGADEFKHRTLQGVMAHLCPWFNPLVVEPEVQLHG